MEIEDILTKKQSLPFKTLALIVVLSLVSGGMGGIFMDRFLLNTGGESTKEIKTVIEQRSYVEESQTIDAIEMTAPAVVNIVATKDLAVYYDDPFGFFFDDSPFGYYRDKTPKIEKRNVGGGSAFVISADGMALTNHHVVADGGADYTAISKTGEEYKVEVLASEPDIDLAVVQLFVENSDGEDSDLKKPDNLSVVKFGRSSDLKVGQKVLAIGNALGQYDNTVTSGIVSGKERDIIAGDRNGNSERLIGLIQTDAAINPGNSGGPLVNLEGEVVGINVAVDRGGSNISFAIPIDDINPVIESIRKHGRIIRPMLGVRFMILNGSLAEDLQIPVEHGALLVGDELNGQFAVIPGGPADKAGLKIKDVILEIDGKRVDEDNSLRSIIRNHQVGDVLHLRIWRSGEEIEVDVVLDELSQ